MRQIGTLEDERKARLFGDYLVASRINCTVEEGKSGWDIWVERDDDLDRARDELEQFRLNPDDSKYISVAPVASTLRSESEKRERKLRRNYIDVRTNWSRMALRPQPVTTTLIVICVAVFMLQMSPLKGRVEGMLLLSTEMPERHWSLESFSMILRGQVWRLISNIFLHFGILHIVFNMIWLADLGNMIERQKGSLKLAGIVLAAALVSAIVQNYWFTWGPFFGGMSGVVYALFGYIWVKGRIAPHEGLEVNETTVTIMLLWLVLAHFLPGLKIANGAHLGGLAAGVIIAYMPRWWRKARRRIRLGAGG